jgi:hypothetical protein
MARLCGKERNFTGEHFWAAVMRYQPSGSNWSRCAPASASRTWLMEQADSFESPILRASRDA